MISKVTQKLSNIFLKFTLLTVYKKNIYEKFNFYVIVFNTPKFLFKRVKVIF